MEDPRKLEPLLNEFESAVRLGFEFYLQNFEFLKEVEKVAKFIGSQRQRLGLEFQHYLFLKAQIPFLECSEVYYSIEYHIYEESFEGTSEYTTTNTDRVSCISDMMLSMGWNYFLDQSCTKLLYTVIQDRVERYEEDRDSPVLLSLKTWFDQVVKSWLSRIMDQN